MIKGYPEKWFPDGVAAIGDLLSLCCTVEHQIKHSSTCNCRNTLHQIAHTLAVVLGYLAAAIEEGKTGILNPDRTSRTVQTSCICLEAKRHPLRMRAV